MKKIFRHLLILIIILNCLPFKIFGEEIRIDIDSQAERDTGFSHCIKRRS